MRREIARLTLTNGRPWVMKGLKRIPLFSSQMKEFTCNLLGYLITFSGFRCAPATLSNQRAGVSSGETRSSSRPVSGAYSDAADIPPAPRAAAECQRANSPAPAANPSRPCAKTPSPVDDRDPLPSRQLRRSQTHSLHYCFYDCDEIDRGGQHFPASTP